ncbi:unnamed protein product [Lepidochelys kempii]
MITSSQVLSSSSDLFHLRNHFPSFNTGNVVFIFNFNPAVSGGPAIAEDKSSAFPSSSISASQIPRFWDSLEMGAWYQDDTRATLQEKKWIYYTRNCFIFPLTICNRYYGIEMICKQITFYPAGYKTGTAQTSHLWETACCLHPNWE